jgi:uncharacterized membrane protein YbjE (DUF340 family)
MGAERAAAAAGGVCWAGMEVEIGVAMRLGTGWYSEEHMLGL